MKKTEIRIFALLCVFIFFSVPLAIFAGGTPEAPAAEIQTEGPKYISPNGDDIQDNASLTFKASLYVKSKEGYVPSYGLRIKKDDGTLIREVKNSEKSDINWFFSIFRGYDKFTLSRTITWDGTLPEGGTAEDGKYDVTLWITDPSDKTTTRNIGTFIVDTKPPEASVEVKEDIFSPNDDGNKDILHISQQLSEESIWKASIINSEDTAVRTWSWENSAPSEIEWDGTTDSNENAPNGEYQYKVTCTDKAGNSTTVTSDKFTLNRKQTPLTVSASNQFISPNGDGVQDKTDLTTTIDVSEGLEKWTLSIYRDSGSQEQLGEPFLQKSGSSADTESITFKGLDDSGNPLSEGRYRAVFSASYKNGNNPVESIYLYIDLTKPKINFTYSNLRFSPNNDGIRDSVSIEMRSSEIVTWKGNITDSEGNNVMETDSTKTTYLVKWNGTTPQGKAPEGEYTFEATFTDRAGNTQSYSKDGIIIDLTKPNVTLEVDKQIFTPNSDGKNENLNIQMSSNEDVIGYVYVLGEKGDNLSEKALQEMENQLEKAEESEDFDSLKEETYRTFFMSGTESSISWDGTMRDGNLLQDGLYVVSSRFSDTAGNVVRPNEYVVSLDTKPINITVPEGFSPNGDGRKDTLPITLNGDFSGLESWKLDIKNSADKTVKTFEGGESIQREIIWDGSNKTGKVPEDTYYVYLNAQYKNDQEKIAKSDTFVVDTTPPEVNVSVTPDPFKKTEDNKVKGDVYVSLKTKHADSWNLDILDNNGNILRSFAGEGEIDREVTWSTDKETKEEAPEELLTMRINVNDRFGNTRELKEDTPIAIVQEENGKLNLMVPNIIFGAYKHTLDSAGKDLYDRNIRTIKRVASILRAYPKYNLLVEGHALNVFRGTNATKERKEESILQPLTERRAQSVKQALINQGIDQNRISKEAYGGKEPMVDVHDTDIRWKNRRVEFVLVPKNE